MLRITHLRAYELLDSRGNPTVEVEAVLSDRSAARASVPSGASTGSQEAKELRDQDASRYDGKGVQLAVAHVNERIFEGLGGVNPLDQLQLDQRLCELDGTPEKSRLGANAILAVSLAVAKAAAISRNLPLYAYMAKLSGRDWESDYLFPTPMMNLINGGKHADNGLDIQEYLMIPVGAPSFSEAVRCGSEVYHALKHLLQKEGFAVSVGDEGGFAPRFPDNEAPLGYLSEAVEAAGYRLGKDVFLGLDCAASEWYKAEEGVYYLEGGARRMNSSELVEYLEDLCSRYPILSIEDGCHEEDWEGFIQLTARLSQRGVQVVGDDLFVTNPRRFSQGLNLGAANAVLVKPNQIGTLSETLTLIRMAQVAGYGVIASHRSGETEDTTIVDLALGFGMGQLKVGSLARTDRVAKYNELLRIERELGTLAVYAADRPYSTSSRLRFHKSKPGDL